MEGDLDDVLHVMMTGCSLNCFFCHKDQEKGSVFRESLPPVKIDDVIARFKKGGFKFVVFSGGNPDENVLAILKLLRRFKTFRWPIIWETHGCVDAELLLRLSKIVDLFIVTVKFGNDKCALKWCGVKKYNQWVGNTLSCLKNNEMDILVRISVIPGHKDCCLPTLKDMPKEFGIEFHREVKIYPELNWSYSMV